MTDRDEPTMVGQLLADLIRQGEGRIMLAYDQNRNNPWTVGYEFGREEPDNPENDMVAGAAYGLGEDLTAALRTVLDQIHPPIKET